MVDLGSTEEFAMKTALVVALLLSAPQAPAVHTPAEAEPPAMSEAIVLDPLAGAISVNHCNVAYTQCPYGSISCTGHTSCESGSGWVECDGHRTYCAQRPPCYKSCMDGYTSCYSDAGDCSGDGVWEISCDGWSYQCGPPRP